MLFLAISFLLCFGGCRPKTWLPVYEFFGHSFCQNKVSWYFLLYMLLFLIFSEAKYIRKYEKQDGIVMRNLEKNSVMAHMMICRVYFMIFLACFLLIWCVFVLRMSRDPCVSRVAKVGLKDMACHPSGSYHAPQTPTLVTRRAVKREAQEVREACSGAC